MFTTALFLCVAKVSSGQWTLQNGTKVSVIFVQPSQKLAWRPDGNPVNLASIPKPSSPIWTGRENYPIITVFTKPMDKGMGGPTIQFKLPSTEIQDASFRAVCPAEKIWISGYRVGLGQPAEQDIAVGVSAASWQIAGSMEATFNGRQVRLSRRSGVNFKPIVAGSPSDHAGPFVTVGLPSSISHGNKSFRVVVLDKKGNVYPFTGANPNLDRPGFTNYAFQGDVKNIARVEVQTHTTEWHTIRVAHFKPTL